VFTAAATKYRRTYKEIPVLIIDNANKMDVDQLKTIQDHAKEATDDGVATVVFVTSEGSVPHIMVGRSAWSRRGHILEISDISKSEALDYLKSRDVNEEIAKKIYGLVGGRMIDLKLAANEISIGVTFESMYSNLSMCWFSLLYRYGK
jgi:hypothetical protein